MSLATGTVLGYRGGKDAERLPTMCWCQRAVVHVPATEVRAGRTGTCDDVRCQPC